MNCQIGYTITNATYLTIVFEHKILEGKKKSYCTVCNKEIRTQSIQSHIETSKHQLLFYKNYYNLPVLDDAFIIKNEIEFDNEIDNLLFNSTMETRAKFKDVMFKAKETFEFCKTTKIFQMNFNNYRDIKLFHVLVPGKKLKPITLPNEYFLRQAIDYEKNLEEQIKKQEEWRIHVEKLKEARYEREGLLRLQKSDDEEEEGEDAVDEYEEEH